MWINRSAVGGVMAASTATIQTGRNGPPPMSELRIGAEPLWGRRNDWTRRGRNQCAAAEPAVRVGGLTTRRTDEMPMTGATWGQNKPTGSRRVVRNGTKPRGRVKTGPPKDKRLRANNSKSST